MNKKDIILNNIKWKNRRRMAWVSLLSILVITLLSFFVIDVDRLPLLDQIITWAYTILGGIVGSYMGLASFKE